MLIGLLFGLFVGFDWLEKIGYSIGGLLVGLIAGIVISLVVNFVALFSFDTEQVYSHSEELYALKDNSKTKGSFFLGTGNVKSDTEYYFMTKRKKGIQMDSVSSSSTYLNEKDGVKPKIKYYKEQFKNKKVTKWFGDYWGSKEYIITIPKNSITTEFKVDLE